MRLELCILSLALLGSSNAQSPAGPCQRYGPAITRLSSSCRTPSAFCSSFLGGSATFTKTFSTTTTTTLDHGKTTVTRTIIKTKNVFSGTTTVAADTTSTTTQTNTVILETPCGSVDKARRSAAGSCGAGPKQNPRSVSGACECIIASSTTTTYTQTSSGSPTKTVTVTKTKTTTQSKQKTTTTTPVSTSTVTSTISSCFANPTPFYIQIDAPGTGFQGEYVSVQNTDPGNSYNPTVLVAEESEATAFKLAANGQLISTVTGYESYDLDAPGPGHAAYITIYFPPPGFAQEQPQPKDNPQPVTCTISDLYELSCQSEEGSGLYACYGGNSYADGIGVFTKGATPYPYGGYSTYSGFNDTDCAPASWKAVFITS